LSILSNELPLRENPEGLQAVPQQAFRFVELPGYLPKTYPIYDLTPNRLYFFGYKRCILIIVGGKEMGKGQII
jgi:hypothetical protein